MELENSLNKRPLERPRIRRNNVIKKDVELLGGGTIGGC